MLFITEMQNMFFLFHDKYARAVTFLIAIKTKIWLSSVIIVMKLPDNTTSPKRASAMGHWSLNG